MTLTVTSLCGQKHVRDKPEPGPLDRMLVPEPLGHEPYFAISQYIFFSFSSMISPWQRRGAQAQTSPMAWPWIMWVSIVESVSCRLSGVTSADDAWTRSGGLWSAATAAGVATLGEDLGVGTAVDERRERLLNVRLCHSPFHVDSLHALHSLRSLRSA